MVKHLLQIYHSKHSLLAIYPTKIMASLNLTMKKNNGRCQCHFIHILNHQMHACTSLIKPEILHLHQYDEIILPFLFPCVHSNHLPTVENNTQSRNVEKQKKFGEKAIAYANDIKNKLMRFKQMGTNCPLKTPSFFTINFSISHCLFLKPSTTARTQRLLHSPAFNLKQMININ